MLSKVEWPVLLPRREKTGECGDGFEYKSNSVRLAVLICRKRRHQAVETGLFPLSSNVYRRCTYEKIMKF